MKTLALLLALAAPCAAAKTPARLAGTAESSEARLAANDPAGALAEAEAAVAKRGGASTYAARGNAKLALGRPLDESIADYREAARLDPKYKDRYEGLVVQRDSQAHPGKALTGGLEMTSFPDLLAKALMTVGVIFLIVIVGEALVRGWRDR